MKQAKRSKKKDVFFKWMRVDVDAADNLKIEALARLLKVDDATALGCVVKTWGLIVKHGDWRIGKLKAIAREPIAIALEGAIRVPKRLRGKFTQALLQVELFHRSGRDLIAHDWPETNGRFLVRIANQVERMRRARAQKRKEKQREWRADRARNALANASANALANASANSARSRAERDCVDKTQTRQDKTRPTTTPLPPPAVATEKPVVVVDAHDSRLLWEDFQDKRSDRRVAPEAVMPKGFSEFHLEAREALQHHQDADRIIVAAYGSYCADPSIHALGHPTRVFMTPEIYLPRLQRPHEEARS